MRMMISILMLVTPILCASAPLGEVKQPATPVAVNYFVWPYGNLHQNASVYSSSLTTISCNHPVKVFEQRMGNWVRVQIANQVGYLPQQSLSAKQVKCFQDAYPRFFDQFELTPAELYQWGRLYDLYLTGKSRVR